MRHLLTMVLPVLALVSVPALQAQSLPDTGSLVRITSPQISRGRAAGLLERFTADTVVVAGQRISRSSISRFEVSSGQRSHWLAGMGIGFVSGAALGALTCVLACGNNYDRDLKPIMTLLLSGAGSVAGLVVGGIVGAGMKSDRWHTTSLSTLRIAPTVRSNGAFGVSIGLRF